jgi:hypothetical protein
MTGKTRKIKRLNFLGGIKKSLSVLSGSVSPNRLTVALQKQADQDKL